MNTINVAIAEDHVMVSDGIRLLLESDKSINVIQNANNGEVLLKQIAESDIKPDVILMDIEMPIMGGYEAAKGVLEILPDCKIIFLTSHNSDTFVKKAIQSKARGFLLKSMDSQTL